MLQGLVTGQRPMTTYRDREAQRFLHLLNETNDVEQYLAVKTLRIRLLGDFALLANDTPISSLDVPRLQSLLAYLALHRGVPQSRSHIAWSITAAVIAADIFLLTYCHRRGNKSRRTALQHI